MTKTLIKKQLMEVFAWLYMALMGIVSVTLGVFGSVFNTFSTLYQARDNDLLFAMPITERSVLTARLSGVYAMGLMYELFVLGSDMFSGLPTIIPSFIVLTIPMNLLKSRKRVRQRAPRFREFHLHSTKRNSSSLVGARWDICFRKRFGGDFSRQFTEKMRKFK